MFSLNSKSLIFIKKEKLEFFMGKIRDELIFPPSTVSNLEILNMEAFEKSVSDFLAKFKLKKNKLLIVLSEDMNFQKDLPKNLDEQLEVKVSEFLNTVPFEPGKIAFKKIEKGETVEMFAANRTFFKVIQKVATAAGAQILGIVPLSIFKEKYGLGTELDEGGAKKILSDKKLIIAGNFLSEEEGHIEPAKLKFSRVLVMIIIFGVYGGGGIMVLGILLGLIENPFPFLPLGPALKPPVQTQEVQPKVSTNEATESASEATESAKISNPDLKIQVLNGSGIAGQATAVQKQITDLGFASVEIGNALGTGSTDTTVVFSPKVTTSDRDIIKKELEKTLQKVNTQEGAEDAEFDVIITTGSYS
ncbi:LytR C-terminal domain-containing protein [Candidatus Daviesbacteria bacterium]|nr:LytR C-terminal domain-containing protein [Candidatus Daviesbacteria bacterium]